MPEKNRHSAKKIITSVLWALLGMGTVVLLGAAINIKNSKRCKGIDVIINGEKNSLFIDKTEIENMLGKLTSGGLQGKPLSSLNLAGLEIELKKNVWINAAELFFDNNNILRISVKEREPIARIFTVNGNSFYLDTALARLPLSDKFSAKVPVFTNFSTTNIQLSKADSNSLSDIRNISSYILSDAFWMAQIDQVDITPNRTFEMIPKIGNHIIVFGNAENYRRKFNNLLTFYKQIETKIGWNTYSKINVEYTGQVVAVKRGAADILQDSLRAKQLMQAIIINAQKATSDSINNIQLVQQQDDNNIPVATSTDAIPEGKISTIKPDSAAHIKSISSPVDRSNPGVKKITPEEKKNIIPTGKPFWESVLTSKPLIKKPAIQNTKTTSIGNSLAG